nr:hypothetical protein CFP56_48180 [Quercus suber]
MPMAVLLDFAYKSVLINLLLRTSLLASFVNQSPTRAYTPSASHMVGLGTGRMHVLKPLVSPLNPSMSAEATLPNSPILTPPPLLAHLNLIPRTNLITLPNPSLPFEHSSFSFIAQSKVAPSTTPPPHHALGNLAQEQDYRAQGQNNQYHSLGPVDNIRMDEQGFNGSLELHISPGREEKCGWLLASDGPSLALHPQPMVEIHSGSPAITASGVDDLHHLKHSLRIRPLRSIS